MITLKSGCTVHIFQMKNLAQEEVACPQSHSGGSAQSCCTRYPLRAEPILAAYACHDAWEGSRLPPRSLSEVNTHFYCCCFGDDKGKILFCPLFFLCRLKQPTQILCETGKAINMKINEIVIPSIPERHRHLVLSPPFLDQSQGKIK